jgi:hypothetical protein
MVSPLCPIDFTIFTLLCTHAAKVISLANRNGTDNLLRLQIAKSVINADEPAAILCAMSRVADRVVLRHEPKPHREEINHCHPCAAGSRKFLTSILEQGAPDPG